MLFTNPYTVTKEEAEMKIEIYEEGNFAYLQREIVFGSLMKKEACIHNKYNRKCK